MAATTHESFHMGDGDEYFYDNLHEQGYLLLWRPAPYHWVATHMKKHTIISYTEGDVSETAYHTLEDYMKGLQETKDWWVKHEGKSANPVLAGCAEPYGFLTGDPINLNPPRCKVCNRRMYPDSNGGKYSCLSRCNLEDLGDRLKAEGASAKEYNKRILGVDE